MEKMVTEDERQILLDNPGLVMFNPYRGIKPHRRSILYAFIPSLIALVLTVVPVFVFPGFVISNGSLYFALSMVIFFASIFAIPLLYVLMDDRDYKKNRESHYARHLKLLMPEKLKCNIVTIEEVTVEKAEGIWIFDGKREFFGYVPYVNYFKIEPGMQMAVVYDGEGFEAFIRRDVKTECFYR